MFNRALIITRHNCIWCERAIEALEQLGVTYTTVNIEDEEAVKDFMSIAGFETVPQIFADGEHIGGFAELRDRLRDLEPDRERVHG